MRVIGLYFSFLMILTDFQITIILMSLNVLGDMPSLILWNSLSITGIISSSLVKFILKTSGPRVPLSESF